MILQNCNTSQVGTLHIVTSEWSTLPQMLNFTEFAMFRLTQALLFFSSSILCSLHEVLRLPKSSRFDRAYKSPKKKIKDEGSVSKQLPPLNKGPSVIVNWVWHIMKESLLEHYDLFCCGQYLDFLVIFTNIVFVLITSRNCLLDFEVFLSENVHKFFNFKNG